jgi:hypothetical protein
MMVENNKDHRFTADLKHMQRITFPVKPQIFRHQDLLRTLQSSPVIDRKKLVNTLDYIHFTNGTILVHASDPKYGEEFLLPARLGARKPEEIVCLWEEGAGPLPENAILLHMIVSDELSLFLLPIRETNLTGEGFTAALPDKGHLLGKRRVRRHPCQGIDVNLTQSGFLARGELLDFSPLAFRVLLRPDANGSFVWLNEDSQCMIHLQEEQRTLFSGLCRYIRQIGDLFERTLVLAPVEPEIQRFQKRKKRTPRLRITPPLSAHFEHPFFRRPVHLDICDLTFTGFAVEEQNEDSILMPGMIIPGLEIQYAGALKMICDAQVIYRHKAERGRVRCGLAILDMDFRNYVRLGHIIVHTSDPRASISNEVEMDALWEFFFDTGFIYPKKYYLLQDRREEFKQTYNRLYQGNQEIAAHFTYEENGRIYGHVSMIRAYQRTWMIHHLAARSFKGKRTGLSVLKHIVHFFEGLYRYPSIRMDYMIFYFRPENRFPNFFFGSFTRDLKNPRISSLDLFAQMNHPTDGPKIPLPDGWQLTEFKARHYPALERFYRNNSGGLLLDILQLNRLSDGDEPLGEVYRHHGFLRQWQVHALSQGESLKAVLIVNRSDLGLNLSELLNGIKIIVIDEAELQWKVLAAALSDLVTGYPVGTVPLLIYPAGYPARQDMKVDKQYLLWIMATEHGKIYLEYMEKKTRMALRFLIKYLIKRIFPR